ncbi:ribonuclease H [Senna tora]|uniref:Ribonuclease H n=1 Tax=Senna tora TaxID=362788 RepID=A0A834XBH7_9FABA|nr:ribonuclease H [Senna tora]
MNPSSDMEAKPDRPFRFLAPWVMHNDFSNVVRNAWSEGTSWNMALSEFYDKVKVWNRKTFGNIFQKESILSKIQNIEERLDTRPNGNLKATQENLWKEYESILYQEELLWMQKSRCQLTVNGDRNTRFYHTTTMIRRKRNKVEALMNSDGEWIYDGDTLMRMAVHYFSLLYSEDSTTNHSRWAYGNFPAASIDQVRVVKDCLDYFCEASGQKVNVDKTIVYFSRNVHHVRRQEISSALGFTITDDMGKYLGVPLIHGRVNRHTYNFIVDKVRNRLASWKCNSLSLAGRITMVQSVASAIPNYAMQTASLPIRVCNDVEKLNRDFIWGSSSTQRKTHLVAWENVCKPKGSGGLGVRHMRFQNAAFMTKLGWRLVNQRDDLWVRVLRSKYRCGDDILPDVKISSNSSRLWRAVVRNWNHVPDGMEWRLELHAVVADYTTPSGGWDWARFDYLLPDDVRARIVAIRPPSNLAPSDQVAWKFSNDGRFSIKTAYKSIAGNLGTDRDALFKLIWKLRVPQRVRTCLWLCGHNKLLTTAERVRRGMMDVASCSRCGGAHEDVLHVFRNCPRARNLWMRLVRSSCWPEFFNSDLSTWLQLNLVKKLGRLEFDWHTTFATACWSLWRWRNEIIFGNHDEGTDWFFTVIHRVRNVRDDFESMLSQKARTFDRVNKDIMWRKPTMGWVKINVDGACSKVSSLKASCGGVAQDHNGHFVGAFTRNLGACSALHAELWGVQSGLDMALHFGFEKVVIEMDSLVACELIKSPLIESHPYIALLRGIHGRCGEVGEVVFQHVYREGNRAADAMAAKAYNYSYALVFQSSPPGELIPFLDKDALAVGTSRSCVS